LFGQVDRITGKHFVTRSEVIASHGMAATAQPLANEIAVDILKQGGSAISYRLQVAGCGLEVRGSARA
jgi:hypothetical protein